VLDVLPRRRDAGVDDDDDDDDGTRRREALESGVRWDESQGRILTEENQVEIKLSLQRRTSWGVGGSMDSMALTGFSTICLAGDQPPTCVMAGWGLEAHREKFVLKKLKIRLVGCGLWATNPQTAVRPPGGWRPAWFNPIKDGNFGGLFGWGGGG
jgi:hypothetical protein